MTPIKQLLAGLVAVVMLSTPAVAYKSGVVKRPLGGKASSSPLLTGRYINSRAHMPTAPLGGTFATSLDGENCDVGDNPFVC
jgi:hypothetical protein